MGLDVNVSVEKLEKINDYVDEFKTTIEHACAELETATNDLKQKNSTEDINDILNTVDDIRDIIRSANPTFSGLKEKLSGYIAFVKKLKSITGSN